MRLPDAPPWSPAAAPIWTRVCHFPGKQRRKRQLLMARAYIDDSIRGAAFVMAGYIAPAEAWAAFSDEWLSVLNMKPRLKRFKMKEALNWSEQQWNERLPLFYRVIEDHVTAGVAISIPYDEYRRVFAGRKYVSTPYHFAIRDIMGALATHQHKLHIAEPIDFIFDKGGSEKIRNIWKNWIKTAPEEVKPLLGSPPDFLDDVVVKPLQAADFHAWWVRRKEEMKINPNLKTRKVLWKRRKQIPQIVFTWTKNMIHKEYDRLFGA
jgi:hypothetical protein